MAFFFFFRFLVGMVALILEIVFSLIRGMKKQGTIPNNATADVTVDEYHRYKVCSLNALGSSCFWVLLVVS